MEVIPWQGIERGEPRTSQRVSHDRFVREEERFRGAC